MFPNQIGLMRDHPRNAPPPWAVLSVKCCVVGLLAFPLIVPLLLAGSAALGDSFSRALFFSAAGAWVVMFVVAQYLTTVYPPVARR